MRLIIVAAVDAVVSGDERVTVERSSTSTLASCVTVGETRVPQRGSAATERNKKMADKKIREETSGPRFHLLVHHFLVEVF